MWDMRVRYQITFFIYLCAVPLGSFGWLFGETREPVTLDHEASVCAELLSKGAGCGRVSAEVAHFLGERLRLDAPALWNAADGLAPRNSEASRVPFPAFQSGSAAQPSIASTTSKRDSPPIGAFGGQLLENFKDLFSKQNLKPLLLGSGATALASVADDDVQEYFGATRRAKALGDIGAVVGHPLVLGSFSGTMLLWGYNTENDHLRSFGFSLTQGFIVNAGMTAALKAVIPRTRPNGENENSFPSGHASGTFTTAVIVAHYYSKAAIPVYVTAVLVGLSRIEKNKHYLSDVVAGATLGIIVGRTVCRQTDKFRVGPITWMPLVLPEGGVGVFVSLSPSN